MLKKCSTPPFFRFFKKRGRFYILILRRAIPLLSAWNGRVPSIVRARARHRAGTCALQRKRNKNRVALLKFQIRTPLPSFFTPGFAAE